MSILLLIILAVAAGAPILLTVLVSVASRLEDDAWTLGGPPPSPLEAIARRIVSFSSEARELPVPKSVARAQLRRGGTEAEAPRRRVSRAGSPPGVRDARSPWPDAGWDSVNFPPGERPLEMAGWIRDGVTTGSAA